jgi:hypothetical protein
MAAHGVIDGGEIFGKYDFADLLPEQQVPHRCRAITSLTAAMITSPWQRLSQR